MNIFYVFSISWFLTYSCTISDISVKNELYSEDEYELGMLIAGECIQCDSLEKADVGSVVLNRLETDDYPFTIEDVIQQKNQFHGYCNNQYVVDDQCMKIATLLLNGADRNKDILFFYLKNTPRPSYIKEILVERKYHFFAK